MADAYADYSQSFLPQINQNQNSMQGLSSPMYNSMPNPLNGVSENYRKQQVMKDDYKSYMRQVQQEHALKPRTLRNKNG